jgi:hypothetical protein
MFQAHVPILYLWTFFSLWGFHVSFPLTKSFCSIFCFHFHFHSFFKHKSPFVLSKFSAVSFHSLYVSSIYPPFPGCLLQLGRADIHSNFKLLTNICDWFTRLKFKLTDIYRIQIYESLCLPTTSKTTLWMTHAVSCRPGLCTEFTSCY